MGEEPYGSVVELLTQEEVQECMAAVPRCLEVYWMDAVGLGGTPVGCGLCSPSCTAGDTQ